MFEATPNGIACISIHATTISQPVANFLLLFWLKISTEKMFKQAIQILTQKMLKNGE